MLSNRSVDDDLERKNIKVSQTVVGHLFCHNPAENNKEAV